MPLTEDQTAALDSIHAFLDSPTATAFLLEGGAGVGKTFLLGELLKGGTGARCVAAPTHKAINVLRRKLEAFQVGWTRGFDDYTWNRSDVITGTSAQLLGIRPVITDEQTTELTFAKTNKGILSKIMPNITIIDEVSMLAWSDFQALRKTMKAAGVKLIGVGDAGQLPPVKAKAIPFDQFVHKAVLRQIVRQAEGSAIIKVAWAIREGKPWMKITGPGVRRAKNLGATFLEVLEAPKDKPEEERPVYIAYRNAAVDMVQDAACRKVYGHGRKAFAPGEMVLSETNLYRGTVMLCANQDELVVEKFREEDRDPTTGVPVVLRHRAGIKGSFRSFYLSPEELKDPAHPYRAELKKREELAKKLQEMRRKGGLSPDFEDRRRRAWREFFEWRDQTIISFRHPFAITSHKSQGSTYRAVFADTADLGRCSPQALYVAVTRPKDELILPAV